MRYVIDTDGAGIRTHVIVWDSVIEQTAAVLKRWTGPNPPQILRDDAGAVWDGIDLFFLRSGSSRESNELRRTPGAIRRWLGRNDLTNWDDLAAAVLAPWDEGMRYLDEMRAELAGVPLPVPHTVKRRMAWRDDPGGTFDLDRYCAGQPAYRAAVNRHAIGRQFVTLFVDSCAGRDTRAREMLWRGVAAAVVAEKLEEAGYGVEIVVYDCGRGSLVPLADDPDGDEQNLAFLVMVKRFSDPIDPVALVNAASPWYFRIVQFANYFIIPGQKPSEGFGYVGRLDSRTAELVTRADDAHIIANVWDAGDAARRARSILRKFADPHGQPQRLAYRDDD